MRIAIILNSLSGGGAEKAMKLLANELINFHAVSVIGINRSEPDGVLLSAKSYCLQRKSRSGLLSTLIGITKFLYTIRKVRPDVAIVNCALSEFFSFFLPRTIKLIVVEHANPAWEERRALGHHVRKFLSRRASFVVAVSEHLSFSDTKRTVDMVIENPIDVALASHVVHAKSSAELQSLVFVGRLSNPQKRPEIVLRLAERSKLPVLFLGDGRELDALKSYSKEKSITAEFAGFVKDPWARIPEGSLLVVPSAYEGDGLVVVEAIMRGIPLVVSDIPEFRRFNLHEISYFLNLDDLVKRISRNSLDIFLPPVAIRLSLAEKRDIGFVTRKWNHLLSRLDVVSFS